jgi:hypothetical protein
MKYPVTEFIFLKYSWDLIMACDNGVEALNLLLDHQRYCISK